MNLKIENRYLNITNYPSVEKYFESMASKGWLINKIIAGSIFLFKKIKPQELDFSISPYEIETAFTRKSKGEIKEFESVCESVGWSYATKSYNLHIYYKDKDSDALDIHTDEEEEFKLLESIAKTQMKSYYFSIPFLIFVTWMTLRGTVTSVYAMKNGLNQIIVPLLPMQTILVIIHLAHIKKFLKTNKRNIEMENEIEFSEGKFYFTRINFAVAFFGLVIFILYIFYTAIFLKNKIVLFSFLPIVIGITVGQLYRMFIKPSNHSKRYKKWVFIMTLSVAIVISFGVSIVGIGNISKLVGAKNSPNRAKYKILLRSDFIDKSKETQARSLLENTSILIPKSYEYVSSGPSQDGFRYIETQYSKALTKRIAQELVNRYKHEAIQGIEGSYYSDLGLTQADSTSWNADEAYFLSNDKHEIVLRKGKEVFMLRGIDFADPVVVRVARGNLGL